MDENDFSKIGQSICDTVTDAVNSAMESMDFSGLSEKISSTADHIMQETVGAFTGKNGQGNKNRLIVMSRSPYLVGATHFISLQIR